MNSGKRFENNFKKSIPDNVYYYRFRDGTSSWAKGENTRFQQTNACDCMLFFNGKLFMLELKTHKGKSIPFSCIRDNQLEQLAEAESYGINAGFVVDFQDTGDCYYVSASLLKNYIEIAERKSVPIEWFALNGCHIPSRQLRVNRRYDLEVLIIESDGE